MSHHSNLYTGVRGSNSLFVQRWYLLGYSWYIVYTSSRDWGLILIRHIFVQSMIAWPCFVLQSTLEEAKALLTELESQEGSPEMDTNEEEADNTSSSKDQVDESSRKKTWKSGRTSGSVQVTFLKLAIADKMKDERWLLCPLNYWTFNCHDCTLGR